MIRPPIPPAAPHPLDNVVWSALTSCQATLAEGDDRARRFAPAYARFAALARPSTASMDALARLLDPGEDAAILLPEDTDTGAHLDLLMHRDLVQMIGPAVGEPSQSWRFVVLGAEHRAQMTSLVERTEPGPWAARSDELGRFIGMFAEGRLVAMGGERMHMTGYREISGVCTDPAWRGQGLAGGLMRAVSQAIVARGEVPFLHVRAENATAITLYERLGFVRRAAFRIHVVRRNERPLA